VTASCSLAQVFAVILLLQPSQHRDTPLHYAAGKGHKEIVSLLLDGGADIEAKDLVQQLPLEYHSVASNTTISHHL
jgi:ankyrin repeat protein